MTMDSSWLEKDFYATLGVSEDADSKAIKTAYRKLAQQYHPDKTQGDATAEAKFKEVSEAYEVLSSEAKRKEYDAMRSYSVGSPSAGFYSGLNFGDDLPIDNIMNDFLGRMGNGASGFGFSQPSRSGFPTRGASYEAEMSITFEDSLTPTPVKYTTENGEISVVIPALVEDGAVVTFSGKGKPGANGGPTGDLRVIVNVTPHKWFTRKGLDLTIEAPVTFDEMTLGAVIEVPALNKKTVKVRIPSGTTDGKTLKIKDRGLEDRNGIKGDLYVKLKLEVPKSLTPEAIKAVEAYRTATEKLHTPRNIFKN